MAGCTEDLHVFIYSGLIASYKPKPGERCICGEYSVEEMEAKGRSIRKLELENTRLRSALEAAEQERDRLHAMLNKLVGAEAGMPCNCLGGDLYGECDYCDGRKLLQALGGAEGEQIG